MARRRPTSFSSRTRRTAMIILKDLGKRPISFAFNGGPGSSSVWLHLGMLGPKRIKLPDDAKPLAPPYELLNNPHSLLDITDLVFIDPVSTGFSRPAKGEDKGQFHGYQQDLESIGQFIHEYLSKYGRWRSPKFLIGESYGGLRAAGLSGYLLERYNIALSGIVMISPAINFSTIAFGSGNDLPYSLFLPSYTATAWYHKALPGDLQALPLKDVYQQAVEFANGEYALALMKGECAERRRAECGGGEARAADRAVEGIRRRGEAAGADVAVCEGTAARSEPHDRPVRQPLHGHRRGRCGRELGIRSERVGDFRAVHGDDQRLPAERAEVRGRSRVRDSHRRGAALEVRPLWRSGRRTRRTRCGKRWRRCRS